MGLLGRLETALGLGGLYPSTAERQAALIPALRDRAGYWSRSFTADPLSTARRLLRDRDTLWLQGWRGQPLSSRLAHLASVTRRALPGLPDRLDAVATALGMRKTNIERIEWASASQGFPAGWRVIFQMLKRQGVEISIVASHPAEGAGDLGGAQAGKLTPNGDGTLQLLRPYGPAEAAEEIAAWLAAQPSFEETVVIGANAVLDAALRQHGLPTTGAKGSADQLLAILPLVLELGWSPQDPQQAYELLLAIRGPVPISVGSRLVRSLQRWPAVASPKWNESLDKGLDAIGDDERRLRVRQRIEGIFRVGPSRKSDRYPRAELERRTKLVQRWAMACKRADPEAGRSTAAVLRQCEGLLRLIDLAGATAFSSDELRRWAALATQVVRLEPRYPAEAGLGSVDQPDAVAGPARVIIWWDFQLGHAPQPGRLPWSRDEQDALGEIGVELPDRVAEALEMATRWRRPLHHATEVLLLVCPRRGANGEVLHPHPLWDEIESAIPKSERQRARSALIQQRLEQPTPALRRAVESLPIPAPHRGWNVDPEVMPARDHESPSSLLSLLGCSLQWALHNAGRLRLGLAEPPAGIDNRLLGSVAHEVLRQVVLQSDLDPATAASRAELVFDETIRRLAAPLLLPGAEGQRGEARHNIARTAGAVAGLLKAGGFRVLSTEELCSVTALGTELRGRPDLVLEPLAVLDYKWGGRQGHQRALENGTAMQIAAYARLVAGDPTALPANAYLIVRSQDLLSTTPGRFPGSLAVYGPAVDETWYALERAMEARCNELRSGVLVAPANPDDQGEVHSDEDSIIDGVLDIAPGCRYCDFGSLCGRLFGEAG